jgi:CheY-like chemotaxis protein
VTDILAPLVLLVDDFDDGRAMYAEYLRLSGYRVVEAGDGAAALALTRELLPDVVVVDLALPVLDGWAVMRALDSGAATRDIAVIALTGGARSGLEQRAREAGCDAFLAKPCPASALLAVVRDLLARSSSGAHGASAP